MEARQCWTKLLCNKKHLQQLEWAKVYKSTWKEIKQMKRNNSIFFVSAEKTDNDMLGGGHTLTQ